MKGLKFISMAIITLGLLACEKESEILLPDQSELSKEQINVPVVNNINGTLSFKNVDDFNTTLRNIAKMTKSERKLWENQNDFQSFGTLSEEFYDNIDFKQFNSLEDIKSFVKQHDNYLEIIEDNGGELSCVLHEENNVERYLMDENKMYFINSKAYRQIEDKLICCATDEILKLKSIKSLNDLDLLTNKEIAIEIQEKEEAISPVVETSIQNGQISLLNDNAETLGPEYNKNRINLGIYVKNVQKDGGRYRRLEYALKNQKKTLGLWFRCTRTTSYFISFQTFDLEGRSEMYEPYYSLTTSRENVEITTADGYLDFKIDDFYLSNPAILIANCWASNWSGCYSVVTR